MSTLRDVIAQGFAAEYDAPHQLDHAIEFKGPGWYSLARVNYRDIYQRGKFATYSRIRITGTE